MSRDDASVERDARDPSVAHSNAVYGNQVQLRRFSSFRRRKIPYSTSTARAAISARATPPLGRVATWRSLGLVDIVHKTLKRAFDLFDAFRAAVVRL